MKEWQFNVLFFVGVGGAILLLFSEDLGLQLSASPTAVTGIGAILTYVLTQRKSITKAEKPPDKLKSGPDPDASKREEGDDVA